MIWRNPPILSKIPVTTIISTFSIHIDNLTIREKLLKNSEHKLDSSRLHPPSLSVGKHLFTQCRGANNIVMKLSGEWTRRYRPALAIFFSGPMSDASAMAQHASTRDINSCSKGWPLIPGRRTLPDRSWSESIHFTSRKSLPWSVISLPVALFDLYYKPGSTLYKDHYWCRKGWVIAVNRRGRHTQNVGWTGAAAISGELLLPSLNNIWTLKIFKLIPIRYKTAFGCAKVDYW